MKGATMTKRPPGRPPALEPDDIRRAAQMRAEGLTYRQIGEIMGVPYPTIWRACQELPRTTFSPGA
jgi:hypothetical protein